MFQLIYYHCYLLRTMGARQYTIIGLFVLCNIFATPCSSFCSTNREPRLFHNDRTLYKYVGGKLPLFDQRAPQDCHPVHIYSMVRHGARYPDLKVISVLEELQSLTQQLGQARTPTLCKKDLKALRKWKVYVNSSNVAQESAIGTKEINKIAANYKILFPELLGSRVPVDKFWFSSTNVTQTKSSLETWKKAILDVPSDPTLSQERLDEAIVSIPPKHEDPVYQRNCDKYREKILNNASASPMYNEFMAGPLVRKVGDRVAARLGLDRSMVTPSFLRKIWFYGCSYQQQVHEFNDSYWCLPFTNEDFEVLEYAFDLKNYETKGYGLRLASEKNCYVAKDIISSLVKAKNADRDVGEYYFSKARILHTSNIATLASSFRFYQVDEPLNANNFESRRNREFRFSKMIPTGGHLMFVLYRCGQQTNNNNYKVQVFWNERIVHIPHCGEHPYWLCSLDQLLEIYPEFVTGSPNECDQEEICRL